MDQDSRMTPKVSGYLEKKGKMKVMSSYKRYWFVLEGRLLLYYRSKDEYEAISPCKGSINLGPPCNVKPCPALPGVFQIETRTSTITLRAGDREDQNRWMHGIMAALNQNKNSAKLSHFRYSTDDLPQQQVNNRSLQSKSLPAPTVSSKGQSNEEIIQRLQRMGAHSYGSNVRAINQVANVKENENINCNLEEYMEKVPIDIKTSRNSVLIENSEYEAIIKKSISSESIEKGMEINSIDNIYERITRESTIPTNSVKEAAYSIPNKNIGYKENIQTQRSSASIVYDNNVLGKTGADQNSGTKNVDRSTFLLENETYGTADTCTAQKSKENTTRKSFVLENDNYCSVDKIIKQSQGSSELIYAEPKYNDTDHNENTLGPDWFRTEENAYSIAKLCNSDNNINDLYEYEDLDKYAQYTEPQYCANENIYAECTEKTETKVKKEKKRKLRKDSTDNEKTEMKLKKNASFIRRIWKKKSKHKELKDHEEELYESVPTTVVEKVSINDEATIQMLSELHNILEHKKPILKERLATEAKPNKNVDEKPSKNKKNFTNPNICSSPTRDETAIHMLWELQNILENKKPVFTGRISSEDLSVDLTELAKNPTQKEDETTVPANVNDEGATSIGSAKVHPLLPPKHQKTGVDSPYHDVPKNNKPINKMLPPKKKQNFDKLKSLDEILNDLDKEKSEDIGKNKMKTLIKQFDEPEFSENEVILRTHKENNHCKDDIDSDELNQLLDELAKVTCAPILTPGVTTSLISPHLTDKELLKLLPARRRRYSEPDYDIPRPHKSLINFPKKDTSPEGEIGSTRFFGPILKPSDISIKTNEANSSEDISSMTPDSLETNVNTATCLHHSHLPEEEKTSYTSHNYIHFRNYNSDCTKNNKSPTKMKNLPTIEDSVKCFDSILIENDIYAQPKTLHNVNAIKGHKFNEADHHLFFKNMGNKRTYLEEDNLQETFVDSLET